MNMKYNVSELLKEYKKELIISESIDESYFKEENSLIEIISPINLELKLTYNNNQINLKGKMSFKINTQCSRCLKQISKDIVFDLEEVFSKDEEESYNIVNNTIDILPVIYDNLYLQLPNKFLCNEDCKGICQYCGKDKNLSKCNCEENQIDSRFAVLKNYGKFS